MRSTISKAEMKIAKKLMKRGWNDFEDISNAIDDIAGRLPGRSSPLPSKVYKNNIYSVQVFPYPCAWGNCLKVLIRRHDAKPIHSWCDMQRLKNEVFGDDRIMLEVYPKQCNLIDVANMYWFFVLPWGFDCPIEQKKVIWAQEK